MAPPENRNRNPAGPGGVSGGHQGDGDRVDCIALPVRPTLSDNAERLIKLAGPAVRRKAPAAPRRPTRIGEVTVVGQLMIDIPRDATQADIRRVFADLSDAPDGVSVIVRLPARLPYQQRIWLGDALAALDDIPTVELVVEGECGDLRSVREAVRELRESAARRIEELRAVRR